MSLSPAFSLPPFCHCEGRPTVRTPRLLLTSRSSHVRNFRERHSSLALLTALGVCAAAVSVGARARRPAFVSSTKPAARRTHIRIAASAATDDDKAEAAKENTGEDASDEGDASSMKPANQDGSDTGGDDVLDDAALFASLRRRAEEVAIEEQADAKRVAVNWEKFSVRVMAVAARDWVRRVALLETDLFVGTASAGVHRYRVGEREPRQRLKVNGDAETFVPADHQARMDPETSITALAFDGRWLAAGLAGGFVHVWNADGDPVFDSRLALDKPGYVCLLDEGKALVAAAGHIIQIFRLPSGEVTAKAQVPHRVHCVSPSSAGQVVLGLADGTVEVRRSEDLVLITRKEAHADAVSSVVSLEGDDLVTGDASGNVQCWRLDGGVAGDWDKKWSAQHEGRVVALREGAGGIVVSGALDGTVRTWEAATGKPKALLDGHKVWLGSICIDPDKKTMATDGRDNSVFIYDFNGAPEE